MTKTLKSIDPLQLGKILAVLYGCLALVFIPFFFLAVSVASAFQKGYGNTPFGFFLGGGLFMCLLLPFVYAAMGFIAGIVMGWVYNLVSKWVGGLKFEIE